jgi:hypothetical protein
MRFFWSLTKLLAAVLLGIGLAVGFRLLNSDDPIPAIFDNLPLVSADIAPEVDRRIKAAFPLGTPEAKLIADLSGWGFRFAQRDNLLQANLFLNSFVCSQSFFVDWQTDEDRRVTVVVTDHHLSCF